MELNITVIPYRGESPLDNHHAFEVAVDESDAHNPHFYVHEVCVRTMGMKSIEKACEEYLQTRGLLQE